MYINTHTPKQKIKFLYVPTNTELEGREDGKGKNRKREERKYEGQHSEY